MVRSLTRVVADSENHWRGARLPVAIQSNRNAEQKLHWLPLSLGQGIQRLQFMQLYSFKDKKWYRCARREMRPMDIT